MALTDSLTDSLTALSHKPNHLKSPFQNRQIKRFAAFTAIFATAVSILVGTIWLLAVNPGTRAHDRGFLVVWAVLMMGFKIWMVVLLAAGWIEDRVFETDGENGYPYWSRRPYERGGGDIEMALRQGAAREGIGRRRRIQRDAGSLEGVILVEPRLRY